MNDDSHTEDALHLERFLPFRLSHLSNRISGELSRVYNRRHQLTVTEWRIMAILGRYRGLSAGEVAERGALDKVAVSRAVASLLDRELLRREVHPDDRRRSVLDLSSRGRRIHEQVAPAALSYEADLLATLSARDQAALGRIIDRLEKRVSELARPCEE